MSQLSQALSQAADRNRELLGVLSQTDYAPTSLQQNNSYISDLKSQISNTEAQLKKLHATTEDERKDHVKYRDSTMKRFVHRLGGQKGKDKFNSKAEKEEREFLEAWQKEREAHEAKEELQKALARAESDRPHLEADVKRHDEAQRELDILYQHIFSGPTPEVSGEDQLERSVESCRQWFGSCQGDTGREKQALEALERANQGMSVCLNHLQDALSASGYDMMGGGAWADMMERDALSNAQNQLMQANRYMEDAKRIQPAINHASDVYIDTRLHMGDVMFDNIFSDMRQDDRIQKSYAQVSQALQQLNKQVTEQKQRLHGAQGQLQQATGNLENARRELQNIRAQAFERFSGQNTTAAPPAYQAYS